MTPTPAPPLPPTFRAFRLFVGVALGVLIMIGYLIISSWNTYRFDVLGVKTFAPRTVWDMWIPLLPNAVWCYVLYYPLVLAPAGLVRTTRELWRLALAFIVTTGIGWIGFVLIPVRIHHPEITCDELACRVLRSLHQSDGGVNAFPSLHVAHSVLVACIYFGYRARGRWLVAAIAAAITASTVLTAQHYIVDLPAGALIGWFGFWTAERVLGPVRERAYQDVPLGDAAVRRLEAFRRRALHEWEIRTSGRRP